MIFARVRPMLPFQLPKSAKLTVAFELVQTTIANKIWYACPQLQSWTTLTSQKEAGHGTPELDYKQRGHLYSAFFNTTFILILLPYMKAEYSMVCLVVFGKNYNSAYLRGNFPSRGMTPSAHTETCFLHIFL